jgi:hypothetical protein
MLSWPVFLLKLTSAVTLQGFDLSLRDAGGLDYLRYRQAEFFEIPGYLTGFFRFAPRLAPRFTPCLAPRLTPRFTPRFTPRLIIFDNAEALKYVVYRSDCI